MTKAKEDGDIQAQESFAQYATQFWENSLRIEHDLMYYGHMTYSDIEKLPILERDKFLDYTAKNFKDGLETGTGFITRLLGA